MTHDLLSLVRPDVSAGPLAGRDPVTVAVQIQVAEPCRAEMDCARCGGIRFTFPLVGLLRTGVAQAGQLTLCAACDTPQHAVREHTIRPQRDGLPK